MHHQQVILESSAAYILVCIILSLGIAFLLYRVAEFPWSKNWNRVLFTVRAVFSFCLMFLLLGPIIRQINNLFEKPLIVLLYDNSSSVKESADSTAINHLTDKLSATAAHWREKGYDVKVNDLDGETSRPVFTGNTSDLDNALRKIAARYEGKKIDGVVLVSDGIYNSGLSPLYAHYNFAVYTLGVGDTTQRTDVSIKNIAYNKIAYQGNKFPLRVEVSTKNLKSQPIKVTLMQRGKVLDQQTKTSGESSLMVFDFQPDAAEQGIQKIDIHVESKPGESNIRNNNGSVFIEVIAGKKKILVVAPSPHPDIKAMREVIEKNSNYEFLLHIPGVKELPAKDLQPENIDLAIFHEAFDQHGRTREVFQKFITSKTSLFLILGTQSDVSQLAKINAPVKFETPPREFDDVTPVSNAAFSSFTLSPETNSLIKDYPPISVPFGKMRIAPSATSLLFQRVGSLATEKPLLTIDAQNNRKIALLLGEGIWRWPLNEFDRTEKTEATNEIFSKLFQFLSTTEDKRKFRSYPTQQEFSDNESVVFESQVYNDIFEPVYGNTIKLSVRDENGKENTFSYVTSPGNARYEAGGLKEGVYRYKASTDVNGKTEEVRGEFAVVAPQSELQNLTADFDLLRRLSSATGGNFYPASREEALEKTFLLKEVTSTIHSEESYSSLLNLKIIFWILLTFISFEWFVRKYYGGY